MKPTVDTQLIQAQRILTDGVLPAVADDTAADTLRRVVADLRKLSTCWEAAIPFVRWDIAALEALLGELTRHSVDPDVSAVAEWEDAASSYADLCSRQEELRGALDRTLPHLPAQSEAPDAWASVVSYFRARLAADPMTNRTPTPVGVRP